LQQVWSGLQTDPAAHVQSTEPQSLLRVVPQAPLHVGKAQQLWFSASHTCPAAHLLQTRLPQSLVRVVLQTPLQLGSAQQLPIDPALFALHTLPAAQAQFRVFPQPSGKAEPHWSL
jgi:hypothetical protein